MRPTLVLIAVAILLSAGCAVIVRDNGSKHADGPGNSEKAPGQQKKK